MLVRECCVVSALLVILLVLSLCVSVCLSVAIVWALSILNGWLILFELENCNFLLENVEDPLIIDLPNLLFVSEAFFTIPEVVGGMFCGYELMLLVE